MEKLLSVLREQQICYYPSAGEDCSDMLWVRPEYLQTGTEKKYDSPSLYLHTDYYPWKNRLIFQPGQVLHDTSKGKVTVKNVEPLTTLDLPLNKELVDFPKKTENYGKCFLLDVEVDLKNGTEPEQTKLLYCFAENEAFTAMVLLENKIPVTYVCLVGYGYSFGGAKTRGAWLTSTLERLETQCFITDSDLEWVNNDYEASFCYPILSGHPAVTSKTPSRKLGKWATWREVRWVEINELCVTGDEHRHTARARHPACGTFDAGRE
jgi:hypothetical protein